jgi:hypothetical protein
MKRTIIISLFLVLGAVSCKTPKSAGTAGGGAVQGTGGSMQGGGGRSAMASGSGGTAVAPGGSATTAGSSTSQGAGGTASAGSPTTATAGKQVDTAAMVKAIVANKGKYANKELSVLLGDLPIPVRSSFIINNRFDKIDGVALSFDESQSALDKANNDPGTDSKRWLHIQFATPVPATVFNAHIHSLGGSWGADEQQFYSTQLIGNIW